MANLIDTFLNQLTAEEKRDKTREQYGGNLRRFERWLLETHSLSLDEEQVGSVTGLMLTEFYQHLHARGLKVSTRNAYVVALMEFFRFLQNAQVITDNPARVLHTVKEKKSTCSDEHKQYTQTEIEALLSCMKTGNLSRNALRDTAMVALALGSGLRAFELCSLNVSHLSGIQNGAIAVERKGGGWAEVSVADFVYPHVARYLLTRWGAQPNEPLFLSQKGNRMTPNSLWKTLAYKEKQLGLKTGVHIFRHTFLSDIEHDPKGGAAMARDLAGHKSIQITNTYLHTTPQERQEAVNHMGYAHLLKQ